MMHIGMYVQDVEKHKKQSINIMKIRILKENIYQVIGSLINNQQ